MPQKYIIKDEIETSDEKIKERLEYKKKAKKSTKKFIKTIKEYIKSKNEGIIPPEWQASLMMLEIYYCQFLEITYELENMPSVIVEGKYGSVPSPLLGAQQTMAVRIEKYMAEYGMTMKSSAKMGIKEVKEETSPLAQFISGQIEER